MNKWIYYMLKKTECLGCNRIETESITLDTGKVVCSYCEDYKDECLNREKLAKELIAMKPEAAKKMWQKVGNEKLLNVIKRLKNVSR